jgi:hypothetical protein
MTTLLCALRALAITLTLAACVSYQAGSPVARKPEEAPPDRYGNQNEEERRRRWETCLREQAERIDDMVSGATVVARAAIELCRDYAVSVPHDSKGHALPEFVRRDQERATLIVLERRAELRRSRSHRPSQG